VSAVLVHRQPTIVTYDLPELTRGGFQEEHILFKIDGETGNAVAIQSCHGAVTLVGYGVAVITNAVPRYEVGQR
jgi:hypothetical protein